MNLPNRCVVAALLLSLYAGPAEAERYLELGWFLAFNGVVTFKNAPEVREAARLVPADRIMVETDAPFLSPEPVRTMPVWNSDRLGLPSSSARYWYASRSPATTCPSRGSTENE